MNKFTFLKLLYGENVKFCCKECDTELLFEKNGYKTITELDPEKIGTKSHSELIYKAVCKKCGKIIEGYFK